MRTLLAPTRIASSMKYLTAWMASSVRIPRTSMSWWNWRCFSRTWFCVCLLMKGISFSWGGFEEISSLFFFTMVRIMPKMTVTWSPLMFSTFPMEFCPFRRTYEPSSIDGTISFFVSPMQAWADFLFFSSRLCSLRFLRSSIWRIFFSIRSSCSCCSSSSNLLRNSSSCSLSSRVRSFSAWASRISLMVFSTCALEFLMICSACCFASRMISLRFCCNSAISFSYFAIVCSICFSWEWMVCRLLSQYLLSRVMSSKYLSAFTYSRPTSSVASSITSSGSPILRAISTAKLLPGLPISNWKRASIRWRSYSMAPFTTPFVFSAKCFRFW